jgi:hypothetical protein
MIIRHFSHHVEEMLKVAKKTPEPGAAEKYAPWYGAAGLGGLGSVAAQEVVPSKYKVPAAIAGSLAGTAIGVHGGEALGKALDKIQKAKEKTSEKKEPSIPSIIGQGLAGLGLGTVAGYGMGRGVEALARRHGVPMRAVVPRVATAAGGGLGITYPLWKAYEQLALQRAFERKKAKK